MNERDHQRELEAMKHAAHRRINEGEAGLKVGDDVIRPSGIPIPEDIYRQIRDLQDAAAQAGKFHHTKNFLRGEWAQIRNDLSAHFKEEWTRRRRLGIERRAVEVKERLAQQQVEEPDWLRLLPEGVLTPKQREAIVLGHVFDLTLAESAEVAGTSKSAMRDRLAGARRKVERFWLVPGDGSGADLILGAALQLAYKLQKWDQLWEAAPLSARTAGEEIPHELTPRDK